MHPAPCASAMLPTLVLTKAGVGVGIDITKGVQHCGVFDRNGPSAGNHDVLS